MRKSDCHDSQYGMSDHAREHCNGAGTDVAGMRCAVGGPGVWSRPVAFYAMPAEKTPQLRAPFKSTAILAHHWLESVPFTRPSSPPRPPAFNTRARKNGLHDTPAFKLNTPRLRDSDTRGHRHRGGPYCYAAPHL